MELPVHYYFFFFFFILILILFLTKPSKVNSIRPIRLLLRRWQDLCRLRRLRKTPLYPRPHLSVGLPRGIPYPLLVLPPLPLLFVPHDLGLPLRHRVSQAVGGQAFSGLLADPARSVSECASGVGDLHGNKRSMKVNPKYLEGK